MSFSGPPREIAPRVSDVERERVLEKLREHRAAGRLTIEELEERAAAAYAARTLPELDELTRDLPADPSLRTREERLEAFMADLVLDGWEIESRIGTSAVLVRGARPNHLVHGLLTLFTGIWALVWLGVTLSSARERVLVEIDAEGEIVVTRAR